MDSLKKKNIDQLENLNNSLSLLSDREYSKNLNLLSGVSIGQHFRHIIEFYQILIRSLKEQIINYDDRNRNLTLEQNLSEAKAASMEIIDWLQEELVDFPLTLQQMTTETDIKSTFKRELQYVYEHTTHHMAIIKIGLNSLKPDAIIDSGFGVADSTIAYQNR